MGNEPAMSSDNPVTAQARNEMGMTVDIAAIRAAAGVASAEKALLRGISGVVYEQPTVRVDPDDLLALCDLAERALATPPLDADVMAAIEACTRLADFYADANHGSPVAAHTRTLIVAVLAGAAERERQRAALVKYGRHNADCISNVDKTRLACDCGLEAALTATPPDAVADEWARLRAIEALWERTADLADKAYREEATDGR